MPEKLDHEAVVERLGDYQGWEQRGPWLTKQFEFDDFEAALDFVNSVGEIAEDLQHHPDITVQNYNEVVLNITTHEENGITENDFDLVERIEQEL